MPFRIAILGIYHESNTFIDASTQLQDFEKGYWLEGPAILQEYRHAFHELGGMIEVLENAGATILPVMYAEATPGGIISSTTFWHLLHSMMQKLDAALPVNGCLVVPHGAAVSEECRDMDGYWLQLIRNKLGEHIPVVGTLDPHANVSQQMVASTNALIAYKTNPHVDQRQTGKEAAGLLLKMLQTGMKPEQVLLQLPLAISIEQQNTREEPCRSLYEQARILSTASGIISVSIFLGFPYADVPEMGSSLLVIADNKALALSTAKKLESFALANKTKFVAEKHTVQQAVSLAKNSKKPVLMLDMGDNIGGGSYGNSTVLLKALEKSALRFFICLYDAAAVAKIEQCNIGDTIMVAINEKVSEALPYNATVTVLAITDGKFSEASPRHGGQVHFDMGRISIVSTPGGNIIMLTSLRVPPFSLSQLTTFHIHPEDFDVVVAKGVNAPIAAYGPYCNTIIKADTPGVTQADMTRFHFHYRRKPLFPFENP